MTNQMIEKKYKLLLDDCRLIGSESYSAEVYRIQALKDIPAHEVKAGDIGGYVESEFNLSQSGSCWIDEDAKVCECAQVLDDAYVSDTAVIYGDAIVSENACVQQDARVGDNAQIFGHAHVHDNSVVCQYAKVFDYADISGEVVICGFACIHGDAHVWSDFDCDHDCRICDRANIFGHARIGDCECIAGKAVIYDDAFIYGDKTQICGNAIIRGNATVRDGVVIDKDVIIQGNAYISSNTDYVVCPINDEVDLVFVKTINNTLEVNYLGKSYDTTKINDFLDNRAVLIGHSIDDTKYKTAEMTAREVIFNKRNKGKK